MNLPVPFDSFRLEKKPGEYKNFHVAEGDPYPLKGVTYPTAYGDIDGYTGEDGHTLDVFVGTGNLFGYFTVHRPDVEGNVEHKFCLNLSQREESLVLEAFQPVLLEHDRYDTFEALVEAIQPFKN
jgi:hypothetical protein